MENKTKEKKEDKIINVIVDFLIFIFSAGLFSLLIWTGVTFFIKGEYYEGSWHIAMVFGIIYMKLQNIFEELKKLTKEKDD